jgi:hypothetical protein
MYPMTEFESAWRTWITQHIKECDNCKRVMKEGQICDIAWDKFESLFKEYVEDTD